MAVPVVDAAYGHIATKEDQITEKRLAGADIENIVRSYFSDIPVMIQIARCESAFRQTLSDGSVLHGEIDPADIGVMQINEHYHAAKAKALGFDLTTVDGNMAFARDLYERQGTKPWRASASCWSNTIAMR